jgi:hypothetical protein
MISRTTAIGAEFIDKPPNPITAPSGIPATASLSERTLLAEFVVSRDGCRGEIIKQTNG